MTSLFRLLPVALPVLLGCAAGRSASGAGAPSPADEGAIIVQVTNNLTPRAAVTVRIQTASGGRTVLGGVPPGGIRELRFPEGLFATGYRLEALRPDGSSVTSETFQLFPRAWVTWSLKNNILQVTER